MLNIQFQLAINQQIKQKQIHQNNIRENIKRIPYQYKVGDKVLYSIQTKSKFAENTYKGPYEITKSMIMEL